jgi:hypothetical protein
MRTYSHKARAHPYLDGGDEELRAVGVSASVCHAQVSCLLVSQLEVLVVEPLTVDALATCIA